MSPSTALRFSPDLSHSHVTLHKAASHLDPLHYVCNLVPFFYDVSIHEVNSLLAFTTAVEQEYTFLSLSFPRYSIRIGQYLNPESTSEILHFLLQEPALSYVKVLCVMSGPNLTERVTLQQENITCSCQLFYDVRISKIGIFMSIYIL